MKIRSSFPWRNKCDNDSIITVWVRETSPTTIQINTAVFSIACLLEPKQIKCLNSVYRWKTLYIYNFPFSWHKNMNMKYILQGFMKYCMNIPLSEKHVARQIHLSIIVILDIYGCFLGGTRRSVQFMWTM